MLRHIESRPRLGPGAAVLCWTLAVAALAGGAETPASSEAQQAIPAPLAPRSLLLDGAAAAGLMAVVGERGHILISVDQGETWSQARVPTRVTLTGVFLRDAKLGWAVGHEATILRTTDGGQSWESLYSAPQEQRPLLDVWFADERNGFAIGAYGLFLKTADGGATWSEVSLAGAAPRAAAQAEPGEAAPAGEDAVDGGAADEGTEAGDEAYYEGGDFHLNAIARAATGRLYIAAERGTIYRSDDGGGTWAILPSPYEGSLFGVLPLEGDSVLVFGLRGHLYRSEDAGQSWTQIEASTTAMLTDGRHLSGGGLAIVGLAGTLLLSGDGGRSFELRQQPNQQGLSSLIEGKAGHLVLVGEFGVNRLRLDGKDQAMVPAPGEGGRSR